MTEEGNDLPIAVVIPARNRARTIGAAIQSAMAQTRRPAEIIVVDDGSTDLTGRVALDAGATVLRHATAEGAASARNSGIASTSQEYVAFLDSDDVWLPGHLEASLNAIGSHDFITSAMLDTFGRARGNLSGQAVPISYERLFFPENVVCTSTVVARREALLHAGLFHDFDRAEDLDLWIRLLDSGTGLALPRIGAHYATDAAYVSQELATRNKAGTLSVLDRYSGEPWRDRRLLSLVRTQQAWDSARHAARHRKFAALKLILDLPKTLPHTGTGLAGTFQHRRRARAGRPLSSDTSQ